MIVVIFRSRLRLEAAEAYEAFAPKIDALAKVQPGILDYKTFASPDGERVTVAYFENVEAVHAWRDHPEHKVAMRRGRDEFYESFTMEVAEVSRQREFTNP